MSTTLCRGVEGGFSRCFPRQISWVMVPIGQYTHHERGLKSTIVNQPQHRRGEHDAVKAKGELGHAGGKEGSIVGPVPSSRNVQSRVTAWRSSCAPAKTRYVLQSIWKNISRKSPKPVAERLAFHPPGNIGPPGEAEASTQQAEQLSPSTKAVAVALIPARKGDDRG